MTTYQLLSSQAYDAFNVRNIDQVLNLLHPDLKWLNGWKGGSVRTCELVWQVLNPKETHIKRMAFEAIASP